MNSIHIEIPNEDIAAILDFLCPTVSVDDNRSEAVTRLYQNLYLDANKKGGVYDEMSELHDWICDLMEKISQDEINRDGFFLGRYRAFKQVVEKIRDEGIVEKKLRGVKIPGDFTDVVKNDLRDKRHDLHP